MHVFLHFIYNNYFIIVKKKSEYKTSLMYYNHNDVNSNQHLVSRRKLERKIPKS